MTRFAKLITAAMLAMMTLASGATADDKAAVRSFYDFLSNPGSKSHADALRGNLAGDWQSIGDYSGKAKTTDAFVGQMGGFAKLIPNLTWKIEEMIQAGEKWLHSFGRWNEWIVCLTARTVVRANQERR